MADPPEPVGERNELIGGQGRDRGRVRNPLSGPNIDGVGAAAEIPQARLEAVLLVSDRAGFVTASAATVALAAIAMAYWLANTLDLVLPAVPPALYSLVHRGSGQQPGP